MVKILFILLFALFFEAVGVVLLSAGLKEIGHASNWSLPEIWRLILRGATNKHLVAGIAFEAIFFGALLYLLSKYDVSLVWPLTSLGFFVTALFAKFYLKEQISGMRWGGIALIVAGAFLISWSEKARERALKKQEAISQQLQ